MQHGDLQEGYFVRADQCESDGHVGNLVQRQREHLWTVSQRQPLAERCWGSFDA
jgi:hypothetical protein